MEIAKNVISFIGKCAEEIGKHDFTTKGYKVFHYTGSEIVKNSLKISAEIIAFVMDCDIKDISIDSNIE